MRPWKALRHGDAEERQPVRVVRGAVQQVGVPDAPRRGGGVSRRALLAVDGVIGKAARIVSVTACWDTTVRDRHQVRPGVLVGDLQVGAGDASGRAAARRRQAARPRPRRPPLASRAGRVAKQGLVVRGLTRRAPGTLRSAYRTGSNPARVRRRPRRRRPGGPGRFRPVLQDEDAVRERGHAGDRPLDVLRRAPVGGLDPRGLPEAMYNLVVGQARPRAARSAVVARARRQVGRPGLKTDQTRLSPVRRVDVAGGGRRSVVRGRPARTRPTRRTPSWPPRPACSCRR